MDTVLVIEDSRPMQRTLQRLFEADSLCRYRSPRRRGRARKFPQAHAQRRGARSEASPASGQGAMPRLQIAHAPAVPMVVLSANADVEDKVLLLELGRRRLRHQALQPQGTCWLAYAAPCAERSAFVAQSGRAARRGRACYRTRLVYFRRCVDRLHQHGSHARRQAAHLDRSGIQAPEILYALRRTR